MTAKFIFNITYVCNPADEQELLNALQAEIIPMLLLSERASNPRIAKICAPAASVEMNADEGVSYSVQVELDDLNQMNAWLDDGFGPSTQMMFGRFGERVLYFTTILENIPLKNFN